MSCVPPVEEATALKLDLPLRLSPRCFLMCQLHVKHLAAQQSHIISATQTRDQSKCPTDIRCSVRRPLPDTPTTLRTKIYAHHPGIARRVASTCGRRRPGTFFPSPRP